MSLIKSLLSLILFMIPRDRPLSVPCDRISLPYKVESELTKIGNSPTGKVFEQDVIVEFEGKSIRCRRVVVYFNEPIRDGETSVSVFTNFIKEEVNSNQDFGSFAVQHCGKLEQISL